MKLGPEVPLVRQLRFGPAAYAQYAPALVSNGRDFLAFWRDEREQMLVPNVYSTRLDDGGRPAEPFGRRWPYAYESLVASDGRDYLRLWTANGTSYSVQPLDENGSPTGEPQPLDSSLDPRALASNGSTYLVVAIKLPDRKELVAASLDRNGVLIEQTPLRLTANRFDGWSFGLGVSNSRYDILGYEPDCYRCTSMVLRTIDEHDGSLSITEASLALPVPADAMRRPSGFLFPIITAEQIFFAWSPKTGETQFTITDRAGNPRIATTTLNDGFSRLSWDGSEYLLLSRDESVVRAQRVLRDGSIPSEPYLLTTSAKGLPAFASNGTTRMFVWQNANDDLVGRTVCSFSELANGPGLEALITSSGLPQHNIQLAAVGSQTMAVWSDEGRHEIVGAINGAEFSVARPPARTVGDPSITAGANRFLVAWYEDDAGTSDSLLFARRYSAEGIPLDAAPLLIGTSSFNHAPGVSADGDAFVFSNAAAPDSFELLRLDGDTVSRLWTYECPHSERCWGPYAPLKTPTDWIVPYLEYGCFCSPHLATSWDVSLLQMPLSGNGPTKTRTFVLGGYAWESSGLGIAQAGEQFTLAMAFGSRIGVVQRTRSGSTTQTFVNPQTTAASIEVSATDIAWNGSEYVLVWRTRQSGAILAMRLDADGRPIDSVPFEIVAEGAAIAPPSIAVTDRGVVIAYSRGDSGSAGAPRAFMRTLESLPPPIPRRRAARH